MVNAAMDYDERDLRPLFTFRVGDPGTSHAFDIAARMGFPADLLDRAPGAWRARKGCRSRNCWRTWTAGPANWPTAQEEMDRETGKAPQLWAGNWTSGCGA